MAYSKKVFWTGERVAAAALIGLLHFALLFALARSARRAVVPAPGVDIWLPSARQQSPPAIPRERRAASMDADPAERARRATKREAPPTLARRDSAAPSAGAENRTFVGTEPSIESPATPLTPLPLDLMARGAPPAGATERVRALALRDPRSNSLRLAPGERVAVAVGSADCYLDTLLPDGSIVRRSGRMVDVAPTIVSLGVKLGGQITTQPQCIAR